MSPNRNLIVSLYVIFISSFILLCTAASTNKEDITPPVAKVIPHADTLHGDIRFDNYRWLQDKSNPEVIEYLEAENEYTKALMKHTEKYQERLYEEMLVRMKETDIDVPKKIDDYYYYTRREKGKQYSVRCRKNGSLDADEEIILDENELAEGHDYFRIGTYEISPDHQLLAFSYDTTGSERFSLYFKDLTTGKLLRDKIKNTSYGAYYVEWSNDNNTIYYGAKKDDSNRISKLYIHVLGTDQKDDKMLYHEKDQAFWITIYKTKSKKYLIMRLGSAVTTELHYLRADIPTDSFKVIQPRQHGIQYDVGHHSDKFYIRTNDNAENFKLMEVLVENPSKKNWKEVIPHRDSVTIEGLDIFQNHLVVYERGNGLLNIRITNLANLEVHYVDFPEQAHVVYQMGSDFSTDIFRFWYSSLVRPGSFFDYNMNTKTLTLKRQEEVRGYDPSLYQSERIFAGAPDGAMVPISLVHRKGMVKDGNNPLILTAYGSLGYSYPPIFESNTLSLLDRGFIFAIAHVRGGAEMGSYWHDQGRLLNKKNTFTDFIACAEHLISENYTSSNKLVIEGNSAGGLIIGAVTNMRPKLFKAAIAWMPPMDFLVLLSSSSSFLDGEYGNPNEKEYYDYIKSYSPYDNVKAQEYPNMLIIAGFNDPRSEYWQPAKWMAKIRTLKTDNNLLLLKMNMSAGHGLSPTDYLKYLAFEYAFIFDVLGIKE